MKTEVVVSAAEVPQEEATVEVIGITTMVADSNSCALTILVQSQIITATSGANAA
jgi:hypothetical protein